MLMRKYIQDICVGENIAYFYDPIYVSKTIKIPNYTYML